MDNNNQTMEVVEEVKEKKTRKKRVPNTVNVLEDIKALDDIKSDFILKHVKLVGDEKWLKELAKKSVPPDKNGKARKISFVEIRKEFANKYLPNLAKEEKKSFFDMIDEL